MLRKKKSQLFPILTKQHSNASTWHSKPSIKCPLIILQSRVSLLPLIQLIQSMDFPPIIPLHYQICAFGHWPPLFCWLTFYLSFRVVVELYFFSNSCLFFPTGWDVLIFSQHNPVFFMQFRQTHFNLEFCIRIFLSLL